MIDFEHVTKIYKRSDTPALEDIDFHVDDGEFVFLVGHSGAGKSTLLKLILREELPTEGRVMVDGKDVARLRRGKVPFLRRQMGIIFQDFQLLHDRSVYQNLLFVLKATGWKDKAKVEARIDEVLETVGLSDKKNSMPHELSGGEQQRIVVARAMLNHPDIIIADEPTGNLDPETAEYIVRLLKDITLTGTAVIMSTHNIQMLDKFPGIVYRCHDGSVKDVTSEYNSMDLSEDAQTTD